MPDSLDLQRAVESLTKSIDDLRAELVRKDVYDANERARDAAMRVLVKDIEDVAADGKATEERRAADRRLILTSLVLPALLILLQIYLSSRVGGTP